jgi:hypothetical protein
VALKNQKEESFIISTFSLTNNGLRAKISTTSKLIVSDKNLLDSKYTGIRLRRPKTIFTAWPAVIQSGIKI